MLVPKPGRGEPAQASAATILLQVDGASRNPICRGGPSLPSGSGVSLGRRRRRRDAHVDACRSVGVRPSVGRLGADGVASMDVSAFERATARDLEGWDDAALGRAVKDYAKRVIGLSAERGCLPISAAAMVMIASAHSAGARESGVEIRGLARSGVSAGDWRAEVARTDGRPTAEAPDVIAGKLRPDRIDQAVDAFETIASAKISGVPPEKLPARLRR